MNLKTPLILGCLIAVAFPADAVFAGGRRASSFSPSTATRSAPQRASFRGAGAGFQRSHYNSAGASRFNNFSGGNLNRRSFTTNRPVMNSNGTNWNRFNRTTTNRFGTSWNGAARNGANWNRSTWNGSNRFGGAGFNRWNWRHRHHDHDNNFVFFGGFGFPFFSAWDYGYYYPSAYYPYYPAAPYVYDPYTYYDNGSSGYVDPGYDNGGYADPNYDNSGRYHNSRPNDRTGSHNGSVVARVQEQLARDGYYKGAIDGVAGSRTYYAIRAFQRDHNLPADGEITDQLLAEMGLR